MSNPLSQPGPWSDVAKGYQEDTLPMFRQYSQKAIELAKLEADHVVLDVATGPGTLALELSSGVAQVEAIDFSETMVELLRGSIQERGLQNIRASVMDGQKLEFEEQSFERAFSMFGLIFFPDRAAGFGEIYRVLKQGGLAVISTWASLEHSPLMQLMFEVNSVAFPQIQSPNKLLNLDDPEMLRSEMEAAGFTNVEVHHFEGSWEITHASAFLDSMTRGSAPTEMVKRGLSEEAWREKYNIMLKHLEGKLTQLPCTLTSKAYIGVGHKP